MPSKINDINLLDNLMFICLQKLNFISSFLRYCKDITNLLFGVLYTSLATTGKNNFTNLQKTLMFIFMQKNHIYT